MNHLTVLIGDSEEILIELITELLQDEVSPNCELRVHASREANELLALAESYPVDLFVLFLNNILFSDGNTPSSERMRQALRLVSDLRVIYDKPIIVLSGLPEYARHATMVGADYFFQSPFDLKEFRDAVSDCLSGTRD